MSKLEWEAERLSKGLMVFVENAGNLPRVLVVHAGTTLQFTAGADKDFTIQQHGASNLLNPGQLIAFEITLPKKRKSYGEHANLKLGFVGFGEPDHFIIVPLHEPE